MYALHRASAARSRAARRSRCVAAHVRACAAQEPASTHMSGNASMRTHRPHVRNAWDARRRRGTHYASATPAARRMQRNDGEPSCAALVRHDGPLDRLGERLVHHERAQRALHPRRAPDCDHEVCNATGTRRRVAASRTVASGCNWLRRVAPLQRVVIGCGESRRCNGL